MLIGDLVEAFLVLDSPIANPADILVMPIGDLSRRALPHQAGAGLDACTLTAHSCPTPARAPHP
jgi:hypothetical protein